MEQGSERKYSNLIKLNFGLYDFSFEFYDHKGPEPEGKPEEIFSEIVLSPQHAKVLMLILQEKISEYESIFGTISIEANPDALSKIQNRT